jgi:hypothetical protein
MSRWLWVLFCLLLTLLPRCVLAAPFEVTLVLDRSGSMKWNDPQNLRLVAARQLIDLARDGDTVALWQFADGPQELIGPTLLRDAATRARIGQAIDHIDATGQRTDITGALADALRAVKCANSLDLHHDYDFQGRLETVYIGPDRRVQPGYDEMGHVAAYSCKPWT